MAIVHSWSVWNLMVFLLALPCIRTQVLDYNVQVSLHPSVEFKHHAVIRPRFYHGREKREITTTKSGDGLEHLHDLIVGYNAHGKEHILDLRLNRELLPDTYFQKHQENGQTKIHRPLRKDLDLCHYQGSLRGVPESWAAVSTCNGLRGVVFDGEELNYIEPKQSKTVNGRESAGEAFLYKHSSIHEKNLTCGYEGTPHNVNHENLKGLHRFKRSPEETSEDDGVSELRGPYNANKKSRFVELVLVVDHKLFIDLDENKETVYQHCKDIANIINALYVPLNIFIALVGVVVWSEYDEIAIVPNGDTTLTNFLHYRRERLVKQHPNDNAQLLTRIQFDNGVVGKALKGPICTYEFSGGVSMDHSNVVALVATTVAHEMGHNFGMEHDSSDCQCPSSRCIMAPSSSSLSPTKWSSCSEKYLLLAFHQGMDYCLHNKPTKLFGSPVCGNGFVEPGEQCDCGLVDRCTNPCCNASTCMLHTNASCATGECCDFETCRPKVAGSVCRSADQECDLPEFCTGRSEFCPIDVFKMDGETCNHGKAFCYQGMCRTRSDQCKLLWGPSGKSSDTQCYKMNTKGTRHGNCGYNRINQSYVKCVDDNIFCGMLHCKHLNERLEFGMESVSILSHSFINAGGNIIPCRTAIVDLGLNQVDPGLAPDGSKCGEGKMCVNQKCMAVSSLRAGIDTIGCPQNCNGNGVCNSKGHCHCNPGFAPPFCDYPGTGGSEDSGPASDPNAGRRVMTALYIIFLGIVPFVALMALLMYYSRPLVKHWWKKPNTMAANGTRSSTYVAHARSRARTSACCMAIGRWTDRLSCSCRHVSRNSLFSKCCSCLHWGHCRSNRRPSHPRKASKTLEYPPSMECSPGRSVAAVNNIAKSKPMLSDELADSVPTISATVSSKYEQPCNKAQKINKLYSLKCIFGAEKPKCRSVPRKHSINSSRDIVKSELVFTTNPQLIDLCSSAKHLGCMDIQHGLVNVPVEASLTGVSEDSISSPYHVNVTVDLENDKTTSPSNVVPYNVPESQETVNSDTEIAEVVFLNDNKLCSQSEKVPTHYFPGVSDTIIRCPKNQHYNGHKPSSPDQDKSSQDENQESKSPSLNQNITSLYAMTVEVCPVQKRNFVNMKSYGCASSQLITEIVQIVPNTTSFEASCSKVDQQVHNLKKKHTASGKDLMKTRKLKHKAVVTGDIHV